MEFIPGDTKIDLWRVRKSQRKIVALLAFLVGVAAADAVWAAPDLSLIPSVSEARTIQLAATRGGVRRGVLTLLARNETDRSAQVSVRYFRDDGSPPLTLSTPFPRAEANELPVIGFVGGRPTIGAHEIGQIALRFQLVASKPISGLDGVLLFTLSDTTSRADLMVRVSAAFQVPPDVSPEPSTVVMQLTRVLPWWATGRSARIHLVGPGLQPLIANRDHAQDRFGATALLRNTDGHDVEVRLEDLRWDGETAAASVRVADRVDEGEYSGAVSLFDTASGPKLTVTIRQHHWIGWAIGAVLLGSILGGLLPLVSGLARRRDVLRAELRGALAEFKKERARSGQEPASWSLDEALGPEPWDVDEWIALPRLRGAAGLFSRIRWARSDEDLDEDTQWALQLVARVGRWMRIEPRARELDRSLKQRVPARNGKRFRDTRLWEDTERLLLEAQEEPESDEAADQLDARIQRQQRWHWRVADLWMQLVTAEKRARGQARQRLQNLQLDGLTDPAQPEQQRTREQWRDLFLAFRRVRDEFAEIVPQPTPPPAAVAAPTESSALVAALPDAAGAAAQSALTLPSDLIHKVRKEVAEVVPHGIAKASPRELVRSVAARDWLVTTVLALGTILAYVLPLYDETWGGAKDYLTAIAAGFGTQAVVRWALLPAFQSLRVRGRPSPAA